MKASPLIVPLLAIWTGCLSGCATRGDVEALEARLREKESLLRQYQRDLLSTRNQLTVAEREAAILRDSLVSTDGPFPVQATSTIAAVEGLRFNSMLTGGQNKDDLPGDERLHAVLYPVDADGETVKLAGELELEALDPSLPEGSRTIGHWTYSTEQSRKLWHAGFLATGYLIDVPWSRLPNGQSVVLHAKLKTSDGREFAATHTVSLQPAPSNTQPQETAKKELNPPPLPTTETPVNEQWQDRPVPRPAPLELTVPMPREAAQSPPPKESESSVFRGGSPETDEGRPQTRPFPKSLKTSDSWSDDTIPLLR